MTTTTASAAAANAHDEDIIRRLQAVLTVVVPIAEAGNENAAREVHSVRDLIARCRADIARRSA